MCFTTLFMSCNISKSDIIECRNLLKDSISYYNADKLKRKTELRIKNFLNYEIDTKQGTVKKHIDVDVPNSSFDSETSNIRNRKMHYQRIYNSSEFEFKKY